jgi:hypothetical protein
MRYSRKQSVSSGRTLHYLRKFNESFDISDRIEYGIKDIFVEYKDSHELDVVVGRGFLPMTIAKSNDNVIEVKLFEQSGIRYDDISVEIEILIDYMKSLTDKEVKIYGRLDKTVLFHWSGGFSGSHNTLELFFVECVTPSRKILSVHSGSLNYSKTNESLQLDNKIIDDITDMFVELKDSGLNYLVSIHDNKVHIIIHKKYDVIIDLELVRDCVEMAKDYLSGLGDFTEFYRFGFVWSSNPDSPKVNRSSLEYTSFPDDLGKDFDFNARNNLFVSNYPGDLYFEVDGIKIIFTQK